jgi:ABC-2 type transport system ATP-binding protein
LDISVLEDPVMTAPVARFVDVCRDYRLGCFRRRTVRAVDRVTFELTSGEVFGLVGPNRAGKTTLVKMLLSLCKPTSGKVTRLEAPSTDRSTLARVGYMHENHVFPRYLSARELLGYCGALSLVPYDQLKPRVENLLNWVGLSDRANDPISTFSKGMVQRLGLAQALVNDPELLILDEPTEGLDLSGRRLLREAIASLKDRGRTVLLVTHVLADVEELCSRIAVIVRGGLRHLGLIRELTNGRPLEEVLHGVYNS